MTVRCIFTTEMIDVTGDGYKTHGDFYRGELPTDSNHLALELALEKSITN